MEILYIGDSRSATDRGIIALLPKIYLNYIINNKDDFYSYSDYISILIWCLSEQYIPEGYLGMQHPERLLGCWEYW